jgi:hypothetical protein
MEYPHSDIPPSCSALGTSLGPNPSKTILENCPLPDKETIIETMGNPNPPLNNQERDALANFADQVASGNLTQQEALASVLRARLLPKHVRRDDHLWKVIDSLSDDSQE